MATSSSSSRKTHSRSKTKSPRGLPAIVVFFTFALLALATIGGVFVYGKSHLFLPVTACVLLGLILFINDRHGFIRSHQMRRAHEPRRTFNPIEVFILLALFVGNALIGVHIFITR